MMTFDPSTAYANDWRYMDFVETVNWEPKNENLTGPDEATADKPQSPNWRDKIQGCKIRPLDMTKRSTLELAADLGLTTNDQIFQFWPNSDADCDMQQRDQLTRDNNEFGVVIEQCMKSPFGFWLLTTVREQRNAAVTA